MDTPAHTPAQTAATPALETRPTPTPVTATTRRGLATASFCLGFWGTLVFWWYPFGMALTAVALALGTAAVALGIRAGQDGEHLAWAGLFFAATGLGLSVASYRFMQLAFEGGVAFPFLSL